MEEGSKAMLFGKGRKGVQRRSKFTKIETTPPFPNTIAKKDLPSLWSEKRWKEMEKDRRRGHVAPLGSLRHSPTGKMEDDFLPHF